ncbi:MAG: serine/threonine protein kinase [Litorivicinus sp.]
MNLKSTDPTRYCVQRALSDRVYLAQDLRLDRWVVLKKDCCEAELNIGKLLLRCAPALLDLTCDQWGVFEYVPDLPLRDWLSRASLDPRWIRHTSKHLVKALDEVHQSGWVHGDLHPGNVLVSPQGDVRLIDFGSAHHRGVVPATFHADYSAPEALAGQACDAQADIYSVGKLLLQLNRRLGHGPWQRRLNRSQSHDPWQRPTLAQLHIPAAQPPYYLAFALSLLAPSLGDTIAPEHSIREQIRTTTSLTAPTPTGFRDKIRGFPGQPLNKL